MKKIEEAHPVRSLLRRELEKFFTILSGNSIFALHAWH